MSIRRFPTSCTIVVLPQRYPCPAIATIGVPPDCALACNLLLFRSHDDSVMDAVDGEVVVVERGHVWRLCLLLPPPPPEIVLVLAR